LICAKYGKDLLNICYVIGRKKVAQFFLTHSLYWLHCVCRWCYYIVRFCSEIAEDARCL